MLSTPLVIAASFAYLMLLFAVAYLGDTRAQRRPLDHRQRLGLCAVDGCLLHRLDLLRQRRPGRFGRLVVPADLSRPDARDAARVDAAAQDDPHRPRPSHHVDRRLHRQSLRQEPPVGRAGDADRRRRHRPLRRLAAEGDRHRLLDAGGGHALAGGSVAGAAWWNDSTLYIALVLAGFTIAFGTRHLDTTERHEGMVAAIAVESVVKLLAFLAVGAFVTWGLFEGPGDIFTRASARPDLQPLLGLGAEIASPAASGSR
jgi:hypothetical protein